jgi:hypothetical protein
MAARPRDGKAAPAAYAVEVVGKLSRRDAEALALDIKELARRHHLTVSGFTVRRLAREESD